VLLEGPAIEPLLAQVRDEYGSGVRIISADKVRSGGFGGFFAKQHYELSVEVPDPARNDRNEMAKRKPSPSGVRALTAARAQEPPAQTLEQLLERAESRDQVRPDTSDLGELIDRARDRVREAGGEALLLNTDLDLPRDTGMRNDPPGHAEGREAGMTDTAAAVGQRDRADTGAAFAELMAGLDKSDDLGAAIRAKPKAKIEDHSVRPFRPAQATGQPVNVGANTPAPTAPPLPHVPSLAELMGGLGMSEDETAAFDQAAFRTGPPRNPAEAYGAYGVSATRPTSPPAPSAVEPQTMSQAQPPALRTPTELRPVNNDPVVMNLLSVGMPESMAAEITGGDTYAGVLSALAHRPAAPEIPEAPGEILVLAGDLAHIVPIGKQLSNQIGLDQTHLLLAGSSAAGTGMHSSRVMHTPAQAAARAEKLQSSDAAWIVMLDTPVGETDPIWVNDICDALGATAVWAVVDATRKTADTARHLRTLGDVEALVVHNVELTADPATVLGLELPIVSMDGKPATPHAWAAMLCARIAADMPPPAAPPRRTPRAGR
jgi:hypothetical protein